MNSIKLKLIVIYTAVVLVVMVTSGVFMLKRVEANETQKYREQLQASAKDINEQIVQMCDDSSQFADEMVAWGQSRGAFEVQGFILDHMGRVIAPYEARRLNVNNTAVVSALAGNEDFTVGKRAEDINGTVQEWLCYAKPVIKNDEHFVILTRINADSINKNLAQLTLTIVFMVILALLLTGSLWFFFANTLTGPIIALTKHAKEMAGGQLQTEITVHSKDEIGQLTESFNHMARELSNTLANMASEKNKSEAILHNMTDGVLAYDAAGRIIHANNASGELLTFDDIQTAPVEEILSRLGFVADEVRGLLPYEVRENTLAMGDRYVAACVTTYRNQVNDVDGFLIVLQDVTKMTKLDNMRQEFVANVSHELRTPLTSVKSYTETLLEGAIEEPETAMQFLKVIDHETRRMALLVSDLLELSRLDNKSFSLEREVVDLTGLLQLAIRQNHILADNKRQHFTFTPPNKPYFIEANAARINQVITNVLTNSVKYSPENTSIDISMEETERYYRVFIKDHGIGIPKGDVQRIFERFYRVDKARSRAMGGTGLGLAIAKEIMEEHGGRITVSSELGVGTTMVLRFLRYKENQV